MLAELCIECIITGTVYRKSNPLFRLPDGHSRPQIHHLIQRLLNMNVKKISRKGRSLALKAAVGSAVYLYAIMPRIGLGKKPEKKNFRTNYYAHRGLHRNGTSHPENSLPAIRRAVEAGYGIEFDIQVTKDGVPVVFHDFTLRRMCGQKGRVADYTLEELSRFRLLDCGEKIPTFKEALKVVDGKVPLIIEMKVEYMDLRVCRAANQLLRDYPGEYCIESFNPLVLLWYRKNRPDVMRGQLSDGFIHQKEFRTPSKLAPGFFLQFLVTNFVTRPDFVAYNHQYQGNLSRRLWRALFRGKSAAWTVRSEEDLKKVLPHFDAYIFDSFIPGEFPGKKIPDKKIPEKKTEK